jgi:hypothetical protein
MPQTSNNNLAKKHILKRESRCHNHIQHTESPKVFTVFIRKLNEMKTSPYLTFNNIAQWRLKLSSPHNKVMK